MNTQLAKERLLKESNALAERVAKAHRDMEEQIAANTALLTQTSHKRLELVAKQEEITRLKASPLSVTVYIYSSVTEAATSTSRVRHQGPADTHCPQTHNEAGQSTNRWSLAANAIRPCSCVRRHGSLLDPRKTSHLPA